MRRGRTGLAEVFTSGSMRCSATSFSGAGRLPVRLPVLRDRANGARTNLLSAVVTELDRLARPAPAPEPQPGMSDRPAPAPQPPTTVLASQLKVTAPKTLLTDEADVDQYLEEMKKTLLAEIRAGKKVIV